VVILLLSYSKVKWNITYKDFILLIGEGSNLFNPIIIIMKKGSWLNDSNHCVLERGGKTTDTNATTTLPTPATFCANKLQEKVSHSKPLEVQSNSCQLKLNPFPLHPSVSSLNSILYPPSLPVPPLQSN